MYTAEKLISILEQQHEELEKTILLALKLSKSSKANSEEIIKTLNKFNKDLHEHVELENKEFYPAYFSKKSKMTGSHDRDDKLSQEMNGIVDSVQIFLKKYSTSKSICKDSKVFNNELKKIIALLNVRIDTEGEGMYELFLSM